MSAIPLLLRRLRSYNKLEKTVCGKPWTLGEEAAAEIERLWAARERSRELLVDAAARNDWDDDEVRIVLDALFTEQPAS